MSVSQIPWIGLKYPNAIHYNFILQVEKTLNISAEYFIKFETFFNSDMQTLFSQ